jgi:hypothetical protein
LQPLANYLKKLKTAPAQTGAVFSLRPLHPDNTAVYRASHALFPLHPERSGIWFTTINQTIMTIKKPVS